MGTLRRRFFAVKAPPKLPPLRDEPTPPSARAFSARVRAATATRGPSNAPKADHKSSTAEAEISPSDDRVSAMAWVLPLAPCENTRSAF
jgi:hypothetical protein